MSNTSSITNLAESLNAKKQHFLKVADQRKIEVYEGGIQAVVDSGIVQSAKQTGDAYADFTLKNAQGTTTTLSDLVADGPVVLTWYRGGWCPYCNITLRALQQILPQLKESGASLVALTPELPDNSLSTHEKNELSFEVLTDTDNQVAKQYGIVFTLETETAVYYKNAFDLKTYNGNDTDELPLTATYVIDKEGVIRYSFLDADYRNRAEPSDILEALKNL